MPVNTLENLGEIFGDVLLSNIEIWDKFKFL